MARIFITGSADGLGQLTAKALIAQGHRVVLHARHEKRAQQALNNAPGAETVLTADLSNIKETKELALKANAWGNFDVVIHNAGVYQAVSKDIFTVNTLAPYILTSLMKKPKRLIYLSSGMHLGGRANLENFKPDAKQISYSDSKLHVLMLCKVVAGKWSDIYANAINPGWVPTKMGGPNAPDDLQKGYETQLWLATSEDEKAKVSGYFFYHKKQSRYNPEADDTKLRENFIGLCENITGVPFPQ